MAFQAATRFTQAVAQELGTHGDANLVIVAHGTVLTLFICRHNPELAPMQFWQSLTLPCAFVLTLPEMKLVKSFMIDDT